MNNPNEANRGNEADAELVHAVLYVDKQLFRVLYERHYAMAVGIARGRVYDVHLAEDAAQEAFAIAFQTLTSLHDHDRFASWLGTICRRTAAKIAKLRNMEEPMTIDVAERPHSKSLPSQRMLVDALSKLDAVSREIVMLHYFSGLTYQQISAIVTLSPQSIHGRLQRARRKLQSLCIDREYSE